MTTEAPNRKIVLTFVCPHCECETEMGVPEDSGIEDLSPWVCKKCWLKHHTGEDE